MTDLTDGYPILVRNPASTNTSMNIYPRIWVLVQIFTYNLFAGERVIALSGPLSLLSSDLILRVYFRESLSGTKSLLTMNYLETLPKEL
jgi:hypothetical protein